MLIIASFCMIYVFISSFNPQIPFISENAGLVFIWCSAIYSIIGTKIIICTIAKMTPSWIHLEYGVCLIYFYFQHQYDGSAESEWNLKVAFYATFAVLWSLYLILVTTAISQMTNYLGIYCFSVKKRSTKEE